MASSPDTPGEDSGGQDFFPLLSPGSSPSGEDQTATSLGPRSQVDPADHDTAIRPLGGETDREEWIAVGRRSSLRKVVLSPSKGNGNEAAAATDVLAQGTSNEVASRKRASNSKNGQGSGKKGTHESAPFSTAVDAAHGGGFAILPVDGEETATRQNVGTPTTRTTKRMAQSPLEAADAAKKKTADEERRVEEAEEDFMGSQGDSLEITPSVGSDEEDNSGHQDTTDEQQKKMVSGKKKDSKNKKPSQPPAQNAKKGGKAKPPASKKKRSAESSDDEDTARPAETNYHLECPHSPPCGWRIQQPQSMYVSNELHMYTCSATEALLNHLYEGHLKKISKGMPDEDLTRKRLTTAYKHVLIRSKGYAAYACGRVAKRQASQKDKRHKGPCLTRKVQNCNADEAAKAYGISPTDMARYGTLAGQRLKLSTGITNCLTDTQIAWTMATPGRIPEWIATHDNKRLLPPFKNLYASFLIAANNANEKNNHEQEDDILVTMIVAVKAVFWSPSATTAYSEDIWADISRRVQLFGEDPVAMLPKLVDELIAFGAGKSVPLMTDEQIRDNRCRKAAEAARQGNMKKATAILDDDSVRADMGDERVLQEMEEKLHAEKVSPEQWLKTKPQQPGPAQPQPPNGAVDDDPADGGLQESLREIIPDELTRTMTANTSPGPDGVPPLLMKQIMIDDDVCRQRLTDLATRMARGKLPPRFAQLMSSGCGFALEKPGTGKIRPICITPCLRRATASVIARRLASSAAHWMAPYQHAVKTRDGANAAISTARLAMEMHPDSWVGVNVDVENAFSSVTHTAVEAALVSASGAIKLAGGFFRQMYNDERSPSILLPPVQGKGPTVLKMTKGRGVMQGCGLSMLFFCAALHEALDASVKYANQCCGAPADEQMQRGIPLAFADDIHAYGTPEWLTAFFQTSLVGELAKAGLKVSATKSNIFDCRAVSDVNELNEVRTAMNEKVEKMAMLLKLPVVQNVVALGVPLGLPMFVMEQLAERAARIGLYCDKIQQLQDKEVAFHMLTKSATAKADFHVRILAPSITAEMAEATTAHLRRTMRAILGDGLGPGVGANAEMDPPPPLQMSAGPHQKKRRAEDIQKARFLRDVTELPLTHGGLGLRVPTAHLHASFLAGRAGYAEHMRQYKVPWRLAMDGHMRDTNTPEGKAIAQAFASLKVQCEDGKLPVKDVASLLRTEKMTPRALMSGVRDLFHKKVLDRCTIHGSHKANNVRVALLSNGNKWATSIYTAPLTTKPWCSPAEYVTVLRMRVGMEMGLPGGVACWCGKVMDTYHAITCAYSSLYNQRHNAIIGACAKLYRSVGGTVRTEPMLHGKEAYERRGDKRRLDIAVRFSNKRYLIDVSVAATQQKSISWLKDVNKLKAGMTANTRYIEKVNKYGETVANLGDILQVVAFDSAGCPAEKTEAELNAWIVASTSQPEEDGTPPPSVTEQRARIVRQLVQAQASALCNIGRQAVRWRV